ncbi:TetR/AcrR family transcriptional regulator [Streptomyces platensis]|uniref:TetR/AcrR family transcriptional regulator n=1 Tax=Streptomyces platensis TaxID=58346 RepID=UPI002E8131DA|nr:TetR/AcrR family transcriptional regulator [Streptomyces platensis]WTI56604.1 TetR/AcrR family transcriptional regulator [Streptomyces platensis]WUB77905.1 TetR/AcrR family transcriptional regulator [Streptomyces platensis]
MRTIDPAKHAARRQHIVNAACELFATQGFERTTTAQICKAAGMSSGNVFHYFPNKRAIFIALLQDDKGEKTERLAAATGGADPWAALLDVVRFLAAPAAEPLAPPLVMEAMLQAHRDPELAELLNQDNTDEHTVITELLTKAAAAGQIDPGLDPGHAASWVMALIASMYTSAATEPSFDPAGQLPTLLLILERFLRGEPQERRTGAAPPREADTSAEAR